MTINLDTRCKERLRAVLAKRIPGIVVKHGMFVERSSVFPISEADEILPTTGATRRAIEEYISESPWYDFVYGTLSKELRDLDKYDAETEEAPLTSMPSYGDVDSLADRLIEAFESLPWRYSFLIRVQGELGNLVASHVGSRTLANNVEILVTDEAIRQKFSTAHVKKSVANHLLGRGLLGAFADSPEFKDGEVYLQIAGEGFIGAYTSTNPGDKAIRQIKAFYGLCLALRLIQPAFSYRPFSPRARIVIHREVNGTWALDSGEDLDAAASEPMYDFRLHDLNGVLKDEGAKAEWFLHNLPKLRIVLGNPEAASRLLLAAQWLYDSYCGKNELLSFVQVAVAMEILLGDKASSDLVGLGELLSNRCAYLIGKSKQQRDEILSDFRAIYAVRSKIVHRGQSKLALDDRRLFTKLGWMCRRVIQEEIDLISEDQKT